MPKALKQSLQFVLFLSIGLGILYYQYNKLNKNWLAECVTQGTPLEDCPSLFQKLLVDFSTVNYFWIVAVLICFIISNFSRAARWNMTIRPLGFTPKFGNAFWSVMLGYGANLLLPRMGEVMRIGVMSRYEKIPLEKVAGTVVLDRIVDVICLAIFVMLAFLLEADRLLVILEDNMGSNPLQSPILWVLGGIALLVLIVFFLMRKTLAKYPLYQRIAKLLLGFAEGIRSIGRLKNPSLFIMHTIIIWLMYYLMTYLCFFAYAPTASLGPSAGLMVFVMGAFGIVIPSPGGMGTYHFLVTAALMLYGIPEFNGFVFANVVFFSINIFCNALLGILAVILLPRLNKDYEPEVGES